MFSPLNSTVTSASSSTGASFDSDKTSQTHHDEQLRKSARDFEATFIAQMLTFSGLDKSLTSGGGEEVAAFTSFFIESLADQIADNGGFGLAENFYNRLLKMSGHITDSTGGNVGDEFGKL